MVEPPRHNGAPTVPHQLGARGETPERLTSFLEREGVAVLDVVPGAVPGTRRLLLGRSCDPTVTHAVAIAHSPATNVAVETELNVLRWAPTRLRPPTLETVPRAIQRVAADGPWTGLVVTGVPGLRASVKDPRTVKPHALLAAVEPWLSAVWQDSAGDRRTVDLGRTARESLIARYGGSPRLAGALRSVQAAFERLAEFEVPQTLTHGCLCSRHIKIEGNAIVGVDDWGQASIASDPLRELGGLVTGIAGHRLVEVMAGRSSFASLLREFVTAGLTRVEIPPQLWRDVLLLSQTERAAHALEMGDAHPLNLLIAAARARPVGRDRKKGTP